MLCCCYFHHRENTLHIKKDRGRSAALKSGVMVSDLDPDAAHRTGQKLSALDQEDDERLLRYLFTLIRAGKIDEAQQLCVTYVSVLSDERL